MRIEFEGTNVVLLPNPIQGQMDVDDIEIGRITDRISCASIRDAILEVASIGQGLKDDKLALESSLKEIELEFGLEVGTSGNLISSKVISRDTLRSSWFGNSSMGAYKKIDLLLCYLLPGSSLSLS